MLPQYDDEPRFRGPWRALRPPAEEWRERAACRGKPVDWWVPSIGGANADSLGASHAIREYQTKEAIELCAVCPVKVECREFAITHHEEGFWGGTTARERARIRHERRLESEGAVFR